MISAETLFSVSVIQSDLEHWKPPAVRNSYFAPQNTVNALILLFGMIGDNEEKAVHYLCQGGGYFVIGHYTGIEGSSFHNHRCSARPHNVLDSCRDTELSTVWRICNV